jgi:hypothetical protein
MAIDPKKEEKNRMKKVVIRVTLVLTFLLMLGAIFGGVNSAPAYAATTSVHHTAKVAIPSNLPTRVDCASSPQLIMLTDNNTNKVCFSGIGLISVRIYNVTVMCTYHNIGAVIVAQYDNQPIKNEYVNPNGCLTFWNNPINVVTGIDMYN